MQVSKLLVLFCLALLAAVLYIATPAIALEHPWEEGESSGGADGTPGSVVPTPDGDTIQAPLLGASTHGTIWWWFELILNPRIDNNTVQSASVATPADIRTSSADQRTCTNGSMK